MPVQANETLPKLPDLLAIDAEELAARMLEPTTLQAIYEESAAALNRGRTPEGLYGLVDDAIQATEQLWAGLAADVPDYACRKGCSWCCHQTVMVTAPEVLLAGRHIRENFDAAAIARLRGRVAARAREIEGLSNDERMDRGIACAFLEDGECSIYAARPLPCRGGFSEDADYCLALFENREATQTAVADGAVEGRFLVVPKMLFDSAQVGMAAAVRHDGLNADPIELTAAMAIALSDPDTAEKWLQGWPVFDSAKLHHETGPQGDRYVTRPVA